MTITVSRKVRRPGRHDNLTSLCRKPLTRRKARRPGRHDNALAVLVSTSVRRKARRPGRHDNAIKQEVVEAAVVARPECRVVMTTNH